MPACHAGDRRFESGRVRQNASPYAPSARPDGASFWAPHGILRPVKRLPAAILVTVVLAVAFAAGLAWNASRAGPEIARSSARPTPSSTAAAGRSPKPSTPLASPSPSAPGSASQPLVDAPLADVPIVPVAQFRTT